MMTTPLMPPNSAAELADSISTLERLTGAQRELLVSLQTIMGEHGWSSVAARLEILAGPRVFDVRCLRGPATLWHWAGTAEQILQTVDRWFTDRRTTHLHEFRAPDPRRTRERRHHNFDDAPGDERR